MIFFFSLCPLKIDQYTKCRAQHYNIQYTLFLRKKLSSESFLARQHARDYVLTFELNRKIDELPEAIVVFAM